MTAIDYGDWDDLQRCLQQSPIEAPELEGIRDIWLAPIGHGSLTSATNEHQRAWFGVHEAQLQRNWRSYRLWAKSMLTRQFAEVVVRRDDIPKGRHLRYRGLQDAVLLAIAEAHAGRLHVAQGLARDGQRYGDAREPLRIFAKDLEVLTGEAMGADQAELHWFSYLTGPIGYSPLGTWELVSHILTLLSLVHHDEFIWSVDVADRISNRMASPRARLQALSWRIARDYLIAGRVERSGLDALLIQADGAAPSLRVLPRLVEACSTGRYSTFVDALELARATGAVWAQVSALAWMTAMNPTEWSTRSLLRLIAVTGWRRMVLVPPEIAADAALGITSLDLRHRSVIELASVSARPNIAAQVAGEHLDDETLDHETHAVAIRSLVHLGTARARRLLQQYSTKRDTIGELARAALSRPARVPISEREAEVLRLAAKGLTNKEIGAHLTLSEHTIARHIANARSKLGAANRAEAVSRLAEMSRS